MPVRQLYAEEAESNVIGDHGKNPPKRRAVQPERRSLGNQQSATNLDQTKRLKQFRKLLGRGNVSQRLWPELMSTAMYETARALR